MKKQITTTFLVLSVLAILSFGMVTAYRGNYEEKSPEYDKTRCASMLETFEEHDYQAWYELMSQKRSNTRLLHVINEDNFPLFVEAHKAAKAGDYELATQLREELGFYNGAGLRDGKGFAKSEGLGQMNKKAQNYGY